MRKKMCGSSKILRMLLVGLLLAGTSQAPAEAKGLKERFKNAWQKIRSPKNDERKNSVQTLPPVTKAGMRNVLLVSVPSFVDDLVDGTLLPRLSAQKDKKPTIALIEFVDILTRKRNTCTAQVAASLAQHLADLNRFNVVTREHLGGVMDELTLNYSGSVNTRTAARLGELTGASLLIYGQIQLCGSNEAPPSYAHSTNAPNNMAGGAADSGGAATPSTFGELKGALKQKAVGKIMERFEKPEMLRAAIIAQIQLIETQTGRQVFTTSLKGSAEQKKKDGNHLIEGELLTKAADDLANEFIDDFLARPSARYIGLYANEPLEFNEGIDLIQLGDCPAAGEHFLDVYSRFGSEMGKKDLARLMYNHGVSLMCANRSEEALDRLWASLRLENDEITFKAIEFTNDTIDRGRGIKAENDPIIHGVEAKGYPFFPEGVAEVPDAELKPPPGEGEKGPQDAAVEEEDEEVDEQDQEEDDETDEEVSADPELIAPDVPLEE